jgi:hypothetical protein
MTDPTPQAEQRVCSYCKRPLRNVGGKTAAAWSDSMNNLSCPSLHSGLHRPDEPSPAPQTQREWLVADSMPAQPVGTAKPESEKEVEL